MFPFSHLAEKTSKDDVSLSRSGGLSGVLLHARRRLRPQGLDIVKLNPDGTITASREPATPAVPL